MQRRQPSLGNTVRDRSPAEAGGPELFRGDDAVLRLRYGGDPQVPARARNSVPSVPVAGLRGGRGTERLVIVRCIPWPEAAGVRGRSAGRDRATRRAWRAIRLEGSSTTRLGRFPT